MKNIWKKSIHLFLSIIQFQMISSCTSNSSLIKQIQRDEVQFDEIVQRDELLEVIEDLISNGRYGEALAHIKPVLVTTPFVALHPQIYILTSQALLGLGREDDAKFTLDIARQVYQKNPDQKVKDFNRKVTELIARLNGPFQKSYNITAQLIADSTKIHQKMIDAEAHITNSFYETDIRQALFDISNQSSTMIIWDETVQGIVTYEARNIPLSKVLQDLLYPKGLAYIKKDGCYYVGSPDIKNPAFTSLSETQTIRLANIEASQALRLLAEPFHTYVSAIEASNVVSVCAPPAIAQRIIHDLRIIDAPQPQIEIESIIAEFSRNDMQKIGLDWDLIYNSSEHASTTLNLVTPNMTDAIFNLNYIRDVLKIGNETITLTTALKALADAGVAKIRAMPRLRTLNSRTAILATTKEQYFFITGESGQSYLGYFNRLETIRSGIQLEVTPFINDSGDLTISVKPQVDDVVGQGANGLPEISRRNASTTVRVKNGETISIGGLRLTEQKKTEKKIPLLGSIPFLGFIFGKTEYQYVEKELMIFITPHVL